MFFKFLLVVTILFNVVFSQYISRIKNLVYINGVKKNNFSGYGLVVGLSGTGDSRSELSRKSLKKFLEFSGISVNENRLQTRNIAVVAVSAKIDGFSDKGDVIDVHVASIGDAASIDNGFLLMTTLKGADGQVYLVAEGVVDAGGVGSSSRGMIFSGGVVEKTFGSMANLLQDRKKLDLMLKKSSFDVVWSIKKKVSEALDELNLKIIDNKRVELNHQNGLDLTYEIISKFMNLEINITPIPKVIIDKKTGLVVVGNNVRIDSSLVLLPDLKVQIEEDNKEKQSSVLSSNTTVEELADGLLLLGVGSKEIISIFDALNKSGAMNAEIIVR